MIKCLSLLVSSSLATLLLGACSLNPLPETSPPLRSMEEPLDLKTEPDDEPARRTLASGCFSGLYLRSAWFEDPLEPGQTPDALEITRLVENSPAEAAGLQVGDLLLSATVLSEAGAAATSQTLNWPGTWRKLEIEATPGTRVALRYDRAGTGFDTRLTLVARIATAPRTDSERFREEQRTGIVVRTATEVEARAVGLGAGGGAVLVGMSANSPFRNSGLQFRDLIASVDGHPLDHPQMLLSAIRNGEQNGSLELGYHRAGSKTMTTIQVLLSHRDRDLTEFSIPLLFGYSSSRDRTEMSLLYGLIGYQSTPAAAEYTFLWLLYWRTGDRDRLVEVGH